jgi:hypothetical protein
MPSKFGLQQIRSLIVYITLRYKVWSLFSFGASFLNFSCLTIFFSFFPFPLTNLNLIYIFRQHPPTLSLSHSLSLPLSLYLSLYIHALTFVKNSQISTLLLRPKKTTTTTATTTTITTIRH